MSISVDIRMQLESFCLDIHFTEASRRIGILGASGSGKSMSLKAIAGIERPDSGRICIEDRVLYDSAGKVELPPQRRRVGYLFQNYALFPTMTVSENIAAGLSGSRAEKRERVAELVERFRLSGLEKRLPSQLSGGQQQRTALARIMAYSPELILLDEPFSALDAYLRDQMQEELEEILSEYQGTVFLVSHSRDEIYRFSEALLVLDRGRIISHGRTREVFSSPGTRVAAMLTGCKNFSRAERLDAHNLYAGDWGIRLKTERVLPEDLRCIGYRGHQFSPVWGEREENCIRVSLAGMAELPFERSYYLRPEREDFLREDMLTWLVQRKEWEILDERGLPQYLRLEEADILFFR